MRTAAVSFITLLFVSAAFGQQLHQATPADELIRQYHESHHHHLIAEMPVAAADVVVPAATKTFIVSAHQFDYTITPAPFVVNQGDTVTLQITATDSGVGNGHGFFLETYNVDAQIRAGQTVTRTFVATTAGTFTFFCTVSCGSGHPSMSDTMTVAAAATPPTITSINPTSGPVSGGNVVAITGTNFQNGATVKFGDTAAVSTTVNSATSISAIAPAHAAGDVTLTVTNPDGQSASFSSYTYIAPGPSITSIDPSSGPTTGGTVVNITGSNIDASAKVTIGGLVATTLAVTSPAAGVVVRTPPGPFDIAASASRDVVVTNPDGRSATRSGGFTWTLPAPAITSIVPNAAVPAGGSRVTIAGAGFTTALPVNISFGGVAGTNVQVTGPTTLSVTVPAHTAGTVDVVITVGSNSATAAASFSFSEPGKRRRAVKH